MKKIAAITMVRNDDFYLKKWVEYYGREVGRENLFIFFDGLDQEVAPFCNGCNVLKLEKLGKDLVSNDKARVAVMSSKARSLFDLGYDLVIGTDADEYIVADPARWPSLSSFLEETPVCGSMSPLGLDLGQKLGEEKDISMDVPFLAQRHYAQIGTRYTKASIISSPLEWGSGFHRVKGRNFHIAKDLYLFHCGYFDMRRIEERFKDPDRLALGWEKHMKKRSRTIRLVTRKKARNFEKWTKIARVVETMARPPYAWNKPGMLGLKIVVRIPERFSGIV